MKADCIIKNAKIFTADMGPNIDCGSKQGALDFMADFMTAEHEGVSFNKPRDMYFGGRKMTQGRTCTPEITR